MNKNRRYVGAPVNQHSNPNCPRCGKELLFMGELNNGTIRRGIPNEIPDSDILKFNCRDKHLRESEPHYLFIKGKGLYFWWRDKDRNLQERWHRSGTWTPISGHFTPK